MDAAALLKYSLDASHFQVQACYNGLSPEAAQARPIAAMMTANEQLEHLCEVCQAVLTQAAGGTHAWGEFVIPEEWKQDRMGTYTALRQKAVETLVSDPQEPHLKMGINYLSLHETYHVGQLVTLRLTLDPEWNAYSIYPNQ